MDVLMKFGIKNKAQPNISFKPRLKSRSHHSLRSLFDCFSARLNAALVPKNHHG